MEQKDRNNLLTLLDDNRDWLIDMIQYEVDDYFDKERSGFVHTLSLAQYILTGLIYDTLVDPKIKADQKAAEDLRSMLRQAQAKARSNG